VNDWTACRSDAFYAKTLVMKLSRIVKKLISGTSDSRMPGFDEVYYRYWYRDTVHFPGTALQHYLQHGWKEGRDPCAGFSTEGYLKANPDVKAYGLNPLLHFLEFGLSEGRKGWEKDYHAPPGPESRVTDEQQKLLSPPRE
jgi:hypothetical protein